ncbi:DUF2905 domain-containing protein [Halalkalibacter akibai]|uniref:DUF2905 domain-containing protein n=1 Tax=Halalkalibacter akibai (strain ATCC 43226 / DSM 21942 / CIP 109018 / JCM 9157 / 1139) TaxID=1236973 RepID=W4QUV3_HALA3|nr:DUF2905 domain-containing protein [Halalkalibacter akibai]GAE35104.1 hypothetical protein JCM9157_2197 [Halalkalibacter akibai JCM 9157]
MSSFPKMLIIIGILFILVGIVWFAIGRYIPLGKLPGDILIKRENTTFYFPLMTSIIVSVILSLVFFIIGRFR